VDLEGRARTYLEGWRAAELEELRVSLFREHTCMQLQAEQDCRAKLRSEAQYLIDDLQEFDRQLDVILRSEVECREGQIGDASIGIG